MTDAPNLAVLPHMAEQSSTNDWMAPGSLGWFARHELRLALRDMFGGRARLRLMLIAGLVVLFLHGVGYVFVHSLPSVIARHGLAALRMDVIVSVILLSMLMMMIAQAMEAVTRAFYVRGDLELILSSPASARRLFAVRMVATTFSSMTIVALLILPIVNMLALHQGVGWLGAYGVLLSMAALAQSVALAITAFLFRTIGPKRTRLVAQVVGALIGAAVVIGGQVPGILASGTINRWTFLDHPDAIVGLPGPEGFLWLPARAATGDLTALATIALVALGLFAFAIHAFSRGFAARVVEAAGVAEHAPQRAGRRAFKVSRNPLASLRMKELRLIARDPWLVSQSLMQVLYLIPPALLLWKNFGSETGALAVLVPIVVMAAGQLAGGLAWLAISAEDAPDLIQTAPISRGQAARAKVEAVMIGVAIVAGPLLAIFAIASPAVALLGAVFAGLATVSSTVIQYRFRSRSKRSQFRRRQRSAHLATMAETLAAISWAGGAGLAGAGNVFAVAPVVIALLITAMCLPGLLADDR